MRTMSLQFGAALPEHASIQDQLLDLLSALNDAENPATSMPVELVEEPSLVLGQSGRFLASHGLWTA
ncbi:hypothetical protein FG87_34700 [Nocardia vulneris]|uniref:Uncharacterized protein n=1 Tax=Nocardia vulneris TaxID=1141657 RepID=A0ABR4Z694_9NOCA|nr:hypothetical protein FG87_34700 [Nocardia vulneris]